MWPGLSVLVELPGIETGQESCVTCQYRRKCTRKYAERRPATCGDSEVC